MKKENLPKVLAIYLPQFHETEDNNLWWGKGFTEWQAVKTACQYFPDHDAPRVPLNEDYYDLSQRATMEKQAELARRYGIDGFCFYHYYFKDGKKELELPAENLLKWKDIDMPFCFNWASESWVRSWSRLNGNIWTEKYENTVSSTETGILVEQDYGTDSEWVAHFEYLLPFFQDERYIKIDGKPVFLFYNADDIPPLARMSECWRELAVKAGFPGIYLIGACSDVPHKCLDAAMIHEPKSSMYCLNDSGNVTLQGGVRCLDYKAVWDNVINTAPMAGMKTYFCGFTGYDDTPRRGRNGKCIINASADVFREQLARLLQKSMQLGNEFLLINAWNEWGEGMYIEADQKNEYKYLEAVEQAKEIALCGKIEEKQTDEGMEQKIEMLDYNAKKFKKLFLIMDKWLTLEQEGLTDFSTFLKEQEINNVAIYGMASLGKHLLLQLKKENVDVTFAIDRYVEAVNDECVICAPEEQWPKTDAIIITAYEVAAITEKIRGKYTGKVWGLEEIIDRMMKG